MASTVEKLVCMPTQRYDAPSGKVGKKLMGILSVELDRVRARKWNAERVTVFQSVILQRAQGVNNSMPNSKAHIVSTRLLESWGV